MHGFDDIDYLEGMHILECIDLNWIRGLTCLGTTLDIGLWDGRREVVPW